jgi:hypothetical protein
MIPQDFDAYIPVYDAIPESWEDARQYIVEQLKQISNAVNVREVGWFLDQELLSGKQFIPGSNLSGTSTQYRSIFRKVFDASPLASGANTVPHDLTFDNRFTLIDLWVAGTDSVGFQALVISGNDVVMNATDFSITSPMAFDRAYIVCEYIQEL